MRTSVNFQTQGTRPCLKHFIWFPAKVRVGIDLNRCRVGTTIHADRSPENDDYPLHLNCIWDNPQMLFRVDLQAGHVFINRR
jgi:hypothetical protein